MKRRDRILEFLLKPPIWVCIIVWTVGAVTLGGSIVLYYLGLGLKLWALSVHLSALVFFILSVYAVLTVIGLPKRAKNSARVQRFFDNYSVRAFAYAACSIVFNSCYVVFGIIIANLEQSVWLGVLVGYHVFLIIPRITVFYMKKRGDDKEIQNVRAYAYCGFALMLLAFAVVPVIRMVLDDQNSYNYFVSSIIYVMAISTYSFVKLGIALYNLKKVRKSDDMSLKAIKNVSFADALISIFALQAMMLKELNGTTNSSVMNPVTGGLVALFIFAMGLYMLIVGRKKLKSLPLEIVEQADGQEEQNDNSVREEE
ncbi:MAG: hypothetical protein K2O04_04555 [Clostridiales bacterium]|nr:hypothetical protein [Clostridiales bacterium]